MTSRTVTTDAIGKAEAVPDLATVEAVAIGEAESASDARAIAKDRASSLRESISAVSPNQIRTVELQVQDTDELFDPVTDAPFQATEQLHIDCVPENAESIVVAMMNAGGKIQAVKFHLHEGKRQELQNDAIRSAMERAREKAEQMAAAEGLAVSSLREATMWEVNTGCESILDEASDLDPDADLHPAPITVSQGVEVVYELSKK